MENKYDVYRQIRYQRTYRTLGKMTIGRVIIGIILLSSVFFISGLVSQMFAARGHFRTAELLMVAPGWMEKYKPETKAFIEAGVLYQEGDYEAAVEAFDEIEEVDAVPAMKSLANVKLAALKFAEGDIDAAYEAFTAADYTLLSEDDGEEYLSLCNTLLNHYDSAGNAKEKTDNLRSLLDEYSVKE